MTFADDSPGQVRRPGPEDHPDYTPADWPVPVPVVARRPLDTLGTQLIPPPERSLFVRAAAAGNPPAPADPPPTGPAPAASPVPAAVPAGPASPPAPPAAFTGFPPAAGPQPPGAQRPRMLRLPFAGGAEARRLLVDRIRTPLLGCHRIAVLGRPAEDRWTGVPVTLGALLSRHRWDRLVVLGLEDRGPRRSVAGPPEGVPASLWAVGDVFAAVPGPDGLTRPADRLEVLTTRPGPWAPVLDADRYRHAAGLLGADFPLILSDATAAADDVRQAAVELADQLVICASTSAADATAVSSLLAGLVAQGHGALVRGGTVVFTPCPPSAAGADRPVPARQLVAHFGTRCRGVVVPSGRRPASAGTAMLELAALVGDALPATVPWAAARPYAAVAATAGLPVAGH
ncbi:hypothetical protein [Streptomyces sp. CB01881]|uniref:hypothetical protein n=1 Tax=Streptomyces sp. CB01881 TaxID=2078691 RepID=UPI000CDC993B|nr:hypothetical protein [Streptomyces sp. CB01881]AUY52724.1 hypothetical protein C2142_31710 [Streptomyces sp. CB01881]TYC70442.1 hypothetical protein EH183_31775 [Streptomyces sp. CB01881]